MIKKNSPNKNNNSNDDALGVNYISFDSKLFFIIMLSSSIPLSYIFLLLCFSLLLFNTHSHIHRHAIHWQEIKDEVQTRTQYYINTKSCHLIFFFLSSQSNQISFSLLLHIQRKKRDDLLLYPFNLE